MLIKRERGVGKEIPSPSTSEDVIFLLSDNNDYVFIPSELTLPELRFQWNNLNTCLQRYLQLSRSTLHHLQI